MATQGEQQTMPREMSEDQVDEIMSATAAAIEAEIDQMIRALPEGFSPSDGITRLAEFLDYDRPFGAMIGKWRVAYLTIELLERQGSKG
jgi:hypothetical protein